MVEGLINLVDLLYTPTRQAGSGTEMIGYSRWGMRVFGEVVRDYRRGMGLTQEELAARAGVSVRCIRKIETGESSVPRPSTLRLLADAFGLSGDDRSRFCRAVFR